MRLGKKLKSGLRTGLKVGAGILGLGAVAVGGYLGSKGFSTPSVPIPAIGGVAPNDAVPQLSETQKEINRLKALPAPTFRTPQQRASAIQSTDDFIAKYSKFYPDTRP
jgi:hypothetical protein